MSRATLALLVIGLSSACGGPNENGEKGSADSTQSSSSAESSSAESSSATSEDETSATTGVDDTTWTCGSPCDIWNPVDCPSGQKCTAVDCTSEGQGVWDSYVCRQIQGDAQRGDPCQMFGAPTSGDDSCAGGLTCWDVDPLSGEGYCIEYCTGLVTDPVCPAMHYCSINGDGILVLCIQNCDPLMNDCRAGQLCGPSPSSNGFVCIADASGGMNPAGTPCQFVNECNDGLICINSVLVPDPSCDLDPMQGCCTPLCDHTQAETCPLAAEGATCQPYFEVGNAPEGYERVGVCALP